MLTKPSLTLKRRIKAPPARVFAAWTNPEKLAAWFGPENTSIDSVRAEMDVTVGGHFRASFTTAEGEYHEVGGVYREVVPDRRLKFTWAWHTTPERESLVTITLTPDGEGTLLTLHHEQFVDEPTRDNHKRGWGGCLDKLERYLSQE
jgi:uncharacterized protein YndB with AHSA1/START domain